MITFLPQNFTIIENMKAARKFYADLLQSFGVPAKSVTVAPLHSQGDFGLQQTGAGNNDKYFDIGNGQLGAIAVGSQVSKSFYHGDLLLMTRITAGNCPTGSCTTENWLASGPNASLTHFQYKQRFATDTSVPDSTANSMGEPTGTDFNNYIDQFRGVLFNYLRKRVTISAIGNDATETTEFMFTGVRIDY